MNQIMMPNGDQIVVEPWNEASSYRLENLARIASDGEEIWRAELPENTGPDCFVAVRLQDGSLLATTWSGYSVTLALESGMRVRSALVK